MVAAITLVLNNKTRDRIISTRKVNTLRKRVNLMAISKISNSQSTKNMIRPIKILEGLRLLPSSQKRKTLLSCLQINIDWFWVRIYQSFSTKWPLYQRSCMMLSSLTQSTNISKGRSRHFWDSMFSLVRQFSLQLNWMKTL